jgi:hypothetical protein
MQRVKEGIPEEEEEEFGEMCKGRRYKRRKVGAKRGVSHSEPEGRGPYAIIQIMDIPHIRGEKEEFHSSLVIEE